MSDDYFYALIGIVMIVSLAVAVFFAGKMPTCKEYGELRMHMVIVGKTIMPQSYRECLEFEEISQ